MIAGPLYWDDAGTVHACEGSEVHPGIVLVWTKCNKDVPQNGAFRVYGDLARPEITCPTCCSPNPPSATQPVQATTANRKPARAPRSVLAAAYEVYCHVYSPQEAMVTGGCRGGFSSGELIAFLYARSFPKNEWSRRVDEALRGLNV